MTARAFGQIFGGTYGQRKSKTNPDAPTDPVRAHSYDVDDARAKPHRAIGDGSGNNKWAFANAHLGALEDLFNRQRDEGYRGQFRIQPSYLKVYKIALDEYLFAKSGEFIFSYKALAGLSRLKVGTVKRCMRALEFFGFCCHVRRSRKVEEREGMPGWSRATAPNAYYFDCKARMPKEIWKSFWSKLMANLKRVAKIAARAAHAITQCFNSTARSAPREPKTELAMSLERLGWAIAQRDEKPAGSTSLAASAAIIPAPA